MCRFALSFNQRSSRLTVSPADACNEYTCRSVVAMMVLLWTTVAGVLAVADTAYTSTATRAAASPARAANVRRLAIGTTSCEKDRPEPGGAELREEIDNRDGGHTPRTGAFAYPSRGPGRQIKGPGGGKVISCTGPFRVRAPFVTMESAMPSW